MATSQSARSTFPSTSYTVHDDEDELIRGARFLLQTSNLKVFTKAVVALAKVGELLFMEPAPEGLSVKAFNRCKTAYGVFLFSNDFFSAVESSSIDQNKNNACRVSMKSALTAFKGAHFGEKNVLACDIRIDPDADFMNVEMQLVHDVRRLYEINLLEKSPVSRKWKDKSKLKNLVTIPAEALLSIINQMHNEADELIIYATKDTFMLKNFTVREMDKKKAIKSEAKVVRERFTTYTIRRETEIAFSANEFKAFIMFASQHSRSVNLYFDLPASPLVVAIECHINYTAEFCLATVETDDTSLITQEKIQTDPVAAEITVTTEERSNGNRENGTVPSPVAANSATVTHGRVEQNMNDSFDNDEITPTQHAQQGIGGMEERADRERSESQLQPIAGTSRENVNEHYPDEDMVQDHHEDQRPNIFDDDYVVQDHQGHDAPIALPPTPPPVTSHREPEMSPRVPGNKEDYCLEASPSPPPTKRDRKFRKFFMSSASATQHASQQLASQNALANDTLMDINK